jgi:hypothetical protein
VDNALWNDGGEFIRRTVLRLAVTDRTYVIPYVTEVESMSDESLVAAVVLDVFPTVTTGCSRDLRAAKARWLPLGEVQQGVVGRVEIVATCKTVLHRDGDPVAEGKPTLKNGRETEGPPRQVIEVESATWFENVRTLLKDLAEIAVVVTARQTIAFSTRLTVGLAEVERRVKEEDVHGILT